VSPIVAELVVKTDPSRQLCATSTVKVESIKSVYILNLIHQLCTEITVHT